MAETVVAKDLVTRQISAWSYYKTAGGLWAKSQPALAEVDDPKFAAAHVDGAMQAKVGEKADTTNKASVSMNPSDRPDVWLTVKAVDANAAAFKTDGRESRWIDAWQSADLLFRVGTHKVEKEITLKDPAHPAFFDFSIDLPGGFTLAQGKGGSIAILDADGHEWMHTQSPWGYDANGSSVGVTVEITDSKSINGTLMRVVRVTPSAKDLAASTYPVTIDPTTTLSSTSAVEDTMIRTALSSGDNNYGGANTGQLRSDGSSLLFRVLTAGLPAGTINSASLQVQTSGSSLSLSTVSCFRIKAANTWVEGTKNGATEVGSCCWNKLAYNTTNWAGSAGCATSGTDYDAGASGTVTGPFLNATNYVWTITASWISDWRDSVVTNNGVILNDPSSPSIFLNWTLSEDGGTNTQPVWTINYTPNSARIPFFKYP